MDINDDDDERSEEEETVINNYCDGDYYYYYYYYLVVVLIGYYDGLLLNCCASKACLEVKFYNTTPYRDETIDKKRLKCGPMNAERGEDHNGPLTSLIR